MSDPNFGWTAELRRERGFAHAYETLVEELIVGLDADNHALAVELAALADGVRGFGHVKMASLDAFEARKAVLLGRLRGGSGGRGRAAAAA